MGREERRIFEETRQDPSGREETVSGSSVRYGQTMEPQDEFVGDGIRGALGQESVPPREGTVRYDTEAPPSSGARDARRVFENHQSRVKSGDLDGDFSENYAADAVLVTGTGVHRGREGIQEVLLRVERRLVGAAVENRACFVAGDLVFAEWEALTPEGERISAAETYVIRGGRIVAQTLHYESE